MRLRHRVKVNPDRVVAGTPARTGPPTASEDWARIVRKAHPRHCPQPPRGWWCSLEPGHEGPCPARPRWWNRSRFARAWRRCKC